MRIGAIRSIKQLQVFPVLKMQNENVSKEIPTETELL